MKSTIQKRGVWRELDTCPEMLVNPVRNSSGALNLALRGGTPCGAEPGIILKSNPAAAAGPEGLWPGGSSGALFLTG
jgi:hypothetical protein